MLDVFVAGDWDYAGNGMVAVGYAAKINQGEAWNGWAVPFTSRKVTEALVERQLLLTQCYSMYEAAVLFWDGDVVVCRYQDSETEFYDERYAPNEEGLYSIGGYCWTWYIVQEAECLELVVD